MGKRGIKAKIVTDGSKLPTDAPGLSGSEQLAYKDLVLDINRTGYAQGCDLQIVVNAARRLARVRMLAPLVSALESPLVMCPDGRERINPLITELRGAERELDSSMRLLTLCPQSRKSIRTGNREVNPAVESNDSKTAKLLKLMP